MISLAAQTWTLTQTDAIDSTRPRSTHQDGNMVIKTKKINLSENKNKCAKRIQQGQDLNREI